MAYWHQSDLALVETSSHKVQVQSKACAPSASTALPDSSGLQLCDITAKQNLKNKTDFLLTEKTLATVSKMLYPFAIRRPLQQSSMLDLLDRPSGLTETACRPDGCSRQAVGLIVFRHRDPGSCPEGHKTMKKHPNVILEAPCVSMFSDVPWSRRFRGSVESSDQHCSYLFDISKRASGNFKNP